MLLKTLNQQPKWLRNLIVVSIVLGIVFRFYNLDRKVYWYDETMTSMRISGYTQEEVVQQAFDGEVITVDNFLERYQYPSPEKDLNDTLNALAGNPEHSPFYYLIARLWLQIFSHSVLSIRLLSALISLLALPCIYWLCLEVFGLSTVSWLAVAILAISPFHILYAQEAREYALWTVTILLSSAALLRAMRLKSLLSWGIYGISVALGLYTHPFSAFVSIGHGIYVLVTEKFRWSKRLTGYLFSSLGGLLVFVPWLLVVVDHFSKFVGNTASVNASREGFLPLFWGLNLSRIFFDFNQGTSAFSPLHYLSAFLAGYALYYLYRKASLNAWVFIITLMGVTGLALIGPDLILGGRRSSITRYAIPSYLGIQIAVAYLIAAKSTTINQDRGNSKPWRYVAIALVFCGIVSGVVSSQLPVWWHKSRSKSQYNPLVAGIINQAENPLVISDQIPGIMFSLSHLLKPNTHLQFVVKPNIPEIPENFEPIFLYRPSDELKQGIEQKLNWTVEVEPNSESWLWNVEKQ
ncbi:MULTISPECIES: glycosyltransferase family 39 protein [unclassified Coleofasciculus]|uniref:glycosyltransferase family 39 protein n=1 Tax=unclassified Coleofasciculus TaxID=2692782 RepID=UPI0018806CFC|nr:MULTISPECIES: glycosyltransferase family 39 protein [unclassified Coleofasciculus]MBE9128561.1 glycosyltransferase family 39 protein [Coleofasciculus sp. LEGE 07081]MBE9149359.1 glycosyltransferase family 39 protein [Coleofasciculus sp. LEGE 07092]